VGLILLMLYEAYLQDNGSSSDVVCEVQLINHNSLADVDGVMDDEPS